jgi:hypothetical protein
MSRPFVAVAGALWLLVPLGACATDPKPLCVPGASVACVGVGGCAGGQVCNAAGSGFGTCECGSRDAGSDSGDIDAGPSDAGGVDAGMTDAGPDDAAVPASDASDAGESFCDPTLQLGCATGERCAWVSTAMGVRTGVLRCVPAGRVAEDGACVVGPDGETTGYDDCAAGLHCLSGVCTRICDPGVPTSCAEDGCVLYEGLFVPRPGERAVAGLCAATCDPVTQLRRDGTTCGVGSGCFGTAETGVFTCAREYSVLRQGDVVSGPLYTNACAAGFTPFFRSVDGRDVQCAAFCRPVETHAGAPAGAAGEAPYACPDRGAAAPPHECVFVSSYAENPLDPRLAGIGICFDRTGRLLDLDSDGTPETPWPSCTEVSNMDTNADGYPDHAALGCAQITSIP